MVDASAQLLRDGIVLLTWATAVYLVFSLLSLAQLVHKSGSRDDLVIDAGASSVGASPTPDNVAGKSASSVPQSAPALHLSPRYEVALSLAFQGFDIAAIARRCDISVAEAKLVATLAESYQGLKHQSGESHGGITRAAA